MKDKKFTFLFIGTIILIILFFHLILLRAKHEDKPLTVLIMENDSIKTFTMYKQGTKYSLQINDTRYDSLNLEQVKKATQIFPLKIKRNGI